MQTFPPTVIFRHRRENLKKCSLRGLEKREDMLFYSYPKDSLPSLPGYVMLDMQGPVLTPADANFGLLLLDATWRYAAKMADWVEKQSSFEKRSIPAHYQTAYPRRQEDCSDPTRGLASVEALYLAYMLMGHETAGILDHYFWKEDFLKLNQGIL